ncbi:hypothetical protein ACVW0Y_003268, partial [Pseudomonas sp. TE3786]
GGGVLVFVLGASVLGAAKSPPLPRFTPLSI